MAQENYDALFEKCTCEPKCSFPGSLDLAISFASLNQKERIEKLRTILLCLTSPPEVPNSLFSTSQRNRKRSREMQRTHTQSTKYALKGYSMCIHGFLAIVQVSEATLFRHAREISDCYSVDKYETDRHLSRAGKFTVQTVTALAHLARYAELYGLPCPSARYSSIDGIVRFLPASISKLDVYNDYYDQWSTIMVAACKENPTHAAPKNPLVRRAFQKVWNQYFPNLRECRGGTGYCDTCQTLSATISECHDVATKSRVTEALEKHKSDAKSEFHFYQKCTELCKQSPHCGTTHLVFDFAEKVLLPSFRKQPGCLHFITGLKFDLFGVSSSNMNTNFVFGLPEGHWPNGKTANEVLSMLSYILLLHKKGTTVAESRTLCLHADNCGGQNKNRFVLFFLIWLVLSGVYDDVELYFMIAGHTKNICDGSFGNVKQNFRGRDVFTPKDMMETIQTSAETTVCISSVKVQWVKWKEVLGSYFKVPKEMKITQYQYFSVRKSQPTSICARKLHDSTDSSIFEFRSNMDKYESDTVESIRMDLLRPEHTAKWPDLGSVHSSNHQNRRNYLEKTIIEPLFSNNDALKEEYFSSGAELSQE